MPSDYRQAGALGKAVNSAVVHPVQPVQPRASYTAGAYDFVVGSFQLFYFLLNLQEVKTPWTGWTNGSSIAIIPLVLPASIGHCLQLGIAHALQLLTQHPRGTPLC